ncbi:GrpB family protein [Nocardiopsis gilva YIM 90087]|uniref:GrpB family protein n=1 Tax=Nocardiopsis gilva YIM 90087 TaxID=1235441 RepID=A0A223S2D0_9ACTN|nr:GrpB family protein [Nocardiopsis gilva]ASU82227.1 GrpB family protein [Nocardiopsis gilva YIM 90087]
MSLEEAPRSPASPPLPARGEPIVETAHTSRNLLVDGRVRLDAYDPKWPYLFEREAERIREALGDRVLRLEHTGSTSVPGLVAKPCVDMLLLVADSADEDAYVPALEAAGYVLVIREPDWHEHRCFKGPDVNINLHVHTVGDPEADRILAFRDRLRATPADRAEYEGVKRRLSERTWDRIQDYADAKSEVVEAIIARAMAERGA